MKQEEIQALAGIRQELVGYYSTLDWQNAPGTAVTLQRDVADVIELTVKRIDQLLSEYVNFS